MRAHSLARKQGAAHPGYTSERQLLRMCHITLVNVHKRADTEEKKLLNKVFLFFYAQKVFS